MAASDNMRISILEEKLKELSLSAKKKGDSIVFTLMLESEQIGPPITIKPRLKWKHDSGHGGGSYVDGVELDIV